MLSPFVPRCVERQIRRRLGIAVRLAVATRPLHASASWRREQWLAGRAALQRLLDSLGASADAGRIAFPHPRYSLSHSAGVAVAAAAVTASLRGFGIDLELRRGIDPRVARLFLARRERVSTDLLRLWTVKEALYKADAHNAGRVLADYRLADPLSSAGSAHVACQRRARFRYASFRVAGGYFSVAAALRGGAP